MSPLQSQLLVLGIALIIAGLALIWSSGSHVDDALASLDDDDDHCGYWPATPTDFENAVHHALVFTNIDHIDPAAVERIRTRVLDEVARRRELRGLL